MNCEFVRDGEVCRCTRCGREARHDDCNKLHAECRVEAPASACTFRGRNFDGVIHACKLYKLCVLAEPEYGLPICEECIYRTDDPNAEQPFRPVPFQRKPKQRRDPLECVHLGEIVGEVPAKGCGCPGNVTSVWTCDVHGRCTPLAKVEGIQSCRDGECGDYASEPSAKSTSETATA